MVQYVQMWDIFTYKQELIDTCQNEGCKTKKTMVDYFIQRPYPTNLTLNFNWNIQEASCADLLKIYLSFADNLSLADFYRFGNSNDSSKEQYYDLSSFTCFIGAHYLIFVSQKDQLGKNTTVWKLYNDIDVQYFMDWYEVVNFCISSKCVPTILFYEVVPPIMKNSHGQQKD